MLTVGLIDLPLKFLEVLHNYFNEKLILFIND